MKKFIPLLEHITSFGVASVLVAANMLPVLFIKAPHTSLPTSSPVDQQPPTTIRQGKIDKPFTPPTKKPKIIVSSVLTEEDAQPNSSKSAKLQTEKPVVSHLINEYVLGESIISMRDGQAHPLRMYLPSIAPTDPHSGQWWETSMNLPQAWDTSTGGSETILAIIDTGFALNHEEFSGRWHENDSETGSVANENPSKLNCNDRTITLDKSCNLIDDNYDGIVDNESGTTTRENKSQLNCSDQGRLPNKNCNLIDDDTNGFVDDWRGWDFVNFDRSVEAGETDPNGSGTRHASYVTGVAAANANNDSGLVGVDWQTKILPLQALADEGGGTTLSVARAIGYAVDQGADVISMSLGSTYPDSFLRQAIRDAISEGVIIVAAAGNDGCDCISYPANYDEVIAVGAINQSGDRASFSSYGANLDIVAPGVGMYTTSWTPTNSTNVYASNIAGTSLATPLVSASLTVLKSLYPTASSTELVALLSENTNRFGISSGAHRTNTLGFGTVNLSAAATRATTATTFPNLISLAGISHGETLFSGFNLEASDAPQLYECTGSAYGSTPVYRLTASGKTIYSSSLSEVGQAKANGYTATVLGYYCAVLPNDTVTHVRALNASLEFSNTLLR